VPFWPLGLPRWEDPWIVLGLRAPGVSHLTVWRRGPQPGTDAGHQLTFPVPHLHGVPVTTRVLYPRNAGAEATWEAAAGTLTVTLPRFPSACVLRLETS
jgi:alpha-galactosidase